MRFSAKEEEKETIQFRSKLFLALHVILDFNLNFFKTVNQSKHQSSLFVISSMQTASMAKP